MWTMKKKQRLVKAILTLVISVLVVWGYQAPAASADSDGDLEMKIDRIVEDDKKNTVNQETELEKIFPTLFTEETSKIIAEKKAEQQQSLEELESDLFAKDVQINKTLDSVKDDLFTKDYEEIAASTSKPNKDEIAETSQSSNTWLYVLTGFALLLCGGIYVMMQKMLN